MEPPPSAPPSPPTSCSQAQPKAGSWGFPGRAPRDSDSLLKVTAHRTHFSPPTAPGSPPEGRWATALAPCRAPGIRDNYQCHHVPSSPRRKSRLRKGHRWPTEGLTRHLQVKVLSGPRPPALAHKTWEFHFRFQPDFYSKEQQLCTHLPPKLGKNF